MEIHEDQTLLDSFPVLSADDLIRVNALFTPYVFYTTAKDGGRDCECSSCGSRFRVEGRPRTQTPEWRDFMGVRHNGRTRCLKCGREVTLKSCGVYRSGQSLEEWRRVVLLHEKDGAVYGQAYYVRKQYSPGDWRPAVEYMPKALYLFRQGEAIGWRWRRDWTGLGVTPSGTPVQEGWQRMKTPCEPWTASGYSGYGGYFWNGYHLVGLERLRGSFLRYCTEPYLRWAKLGEGDGTAHGEAMRFFSAAAVHPQIEMLLKMGLSQIVNDLVISKRKLTKEIKWGEKDPRKAFGLTGPELKMFCSMDGSVAQLRWYKLLRKAGIPVTFQEIREVERALPGGVAERFFRACAAGCGVRPMNAVGYIKKQGGTGHVLRDTTIQWIDYVEAAKYCGYDLDDPLVLMPKRLKEAHDGAVETELRLRYENETADDSPFQRRYRQLMERYGFKNEDFFIRAPSSSREIIQEGKILHHCVGRYAGRHASGKTTILFMRRMAAPFLPAWTIEINGDRLVQIQGSHNQSDYQPKGEAGEFLDKWLDWVRQGSKRDEQGNPRLPKKKNGTAA